jgi:hypothetical protein
MGVCRLVSHPLRVHRTRALSFTDMFFCYHLLDTRNELATQILMSTHTISWAIPRCTRSTASPKRFASG